MQQAQREPEENERVAIITGWVQGLQQSHEHAVHLMAQPPAGWIVKTRCPTCGTEWGADFEDTAALDALRRGNLDEAAPASACALIIQRHIQLFINPDLRDTEELAYLAATTLMEGLGFTMAGGAEDAESWTLTVDSLRNAEDDDEGLIRA